MKAENFDGILVFVRETDKAIGVRLDEDAPVVWLPKSEIEFHVGDPAPGVVHVIAPEWLATQRGLI